MIDYLPGQFLTLVFLRSGIEERRSYSFSSSPGLNEPLAITIKRVANGEYSRRMIDHYETGDELITIGAAGMFTLPAQMMQVKQLVFLAAGSGITPVFSLIKTVLYLYPYVKILLIYSNRSRDETIFLHALERLSDEFAGRFAIDFLFSNSSDINHARLSNYWLEVLLKKHGIAHQSNALFYLCGPFDYMLMVNIALLSYGILPAAIRKEHFSSMKPPPREEPPDREPHQVKLIMGNQEHHFITQYPLSILQKAKLSGVDLPYSCEAGRCGTCVARCVQGAVWMSNNEVLLDEEIKKGLILTCTGYPASGDVVIEI
ncbi:MAG: iron-sulfur cluster-binding domain-containing protein [Chitinophagaceae bacterium]|nr:iron-sulfur cluster-binding domain-containing protein [Chitinophagaceae bacterium]